MEMAMELALATGLALTTVLMHGAGLMLLARLVEHYHPPEAEPISPMSRRGATVAIIVVLGLFAIHGAEIWLFAFIFHAVGAVPELRDAVYFSTISYGAIGYGDAVIAPEWKLLGAIEGINGSILLGWSVVFFVAVMTRFTPPHRASRAHRAPTVDKAIGQADT